MPTRTRIRFSAVTLALFLLAVPASARQSAEADTTDPDSNPSATPPHKAGYDEKPAFGGPNSPRGQLEEDDRVKKPAFRFRAFDRVMTPWFEWKRRIDQEYGLEMTGHYVALYQTVDESLTGEDDAGSGLFRWTGKWDVTGRETKNTGSLVFMVDHRHGYTDVVPANLGGEAGYLGQTGLLLSEADLVLVNLNWQQAFREGRAGLIVGRFDPSDYFNVLGYGNPWTTFQNLAVLLDASVAFPDASFGIGGGSWLEQGWYVLGTVNDANGTLTEEWDVFPDGTEFFKQAEVGWSPSKDERYLKNANLTFWHVDERENAGIESAEGVLFSANWTFKERWMPFFRAGWSDGSAPIYNRSATVGFIRYFAFRSDLSGLGVNWGDPPDDSLDEQVTVEAFHRFQIAQNFAVTTSVQYLVDPAFNPDEDALWVFGLRARVTY
jgi:porin